MIGKRLRNLVGQRRNGLPGEAHQLLQAVRSHWQIENGIHCVLDFAFREDDSRLRKGHSAHNFAILRRIALNLLKQDKTTKLGIKNKRLKAAWNHVYLLILLSHYSESSRLLPLWNLFDKGNLFHYSTVDPGSVVSGWVAEEQAALVWAAFSDLRRVALGHGFVGAAFHGRSPLCPILFACGPDRGNYAGCSQSPCYDFRRPGEGFRTIVTLPTAHRLAVRSFVMRRRQR